MKILVLDDETRICKILKQMLTEQGHSVVTVERGSHALNMLRMNLFDVLILDILMDELIGTEVIKKIKAMGCKIKIIVLTSVDDEGIQKYITNLEIEKYLIKPYDIHKIKPALEKTISSLCNAA